MSHAVTVKSGLGYIITDLLQMSCEGLQRVAGARSQCGRVREGACMVYDCLQAFEVATCRGDCVRAINGKPPDRLSRSRQVTGDDQVAALGLSCHHTSYLPAHRPATRFDITKLQTSCCSALSALVLS